MYWWKIDWSIEGGYVLNVINSDSQHKTYRGVQKSQPILMAFHTNVPKQVIPLWQSEPGVEGDHTETKSLQHRDVNTSYARLYDGGSPLHSFEWMICCFSCFKPWWKLVAPFWSEEHGLNRAQNTLNYESCAADHETERKKICNSKLQHDIVKTLEPFCQKI